MAIILAVFAHPDDEAFGPSGTLAKLAKKNDVYLICATRGGSQKSKHNHLKKTRSKELRDSAKILGVKKVYFFGFTDGYLSNILYHKLAGRIQQKIKTLKPDTLITFEPRGVSGHIDHIVVSMVTAFVFYKNPRIKKLMYFCLSKEQRKLIPKYFIYFPPGYKKSDIDKVVNISDVWDTKIKSILAHKSQKKDSQNLLRSMKHLPKEEYFLELKK